MKPSPILQHASLLRLILFCLFIINLHHCAPNGYGLVYNSHVPASINVNTNRSIGKMPILGAKSDASQYITLYTSIQPIDREKYTHRSWAALTALCNVVQRQT